MEPAKAPLQNRVSPFGELFSSTARGTLFGNRGGKFHNADRTLGSRRFASRQWICCVLQFKNRQRDVWGRYYTELFFLDEVTALAAGHRPCFECRRADAKAFANAFAKGQGHSTSLTAPRMDRILHGERLDGRGKRRHRMKIGDLPDAAVVVLPHADGEQPFAVAGGDLLRWTPFGYDNRIARPQRISVDVLTPPSIIAALKNGFAPRWHESAGVVPAGAVATKRR